MRQLASGPFAACMTFLLGVGWVGLVGALFTWPADRLPGLGEVDPPQIRTEEEPAFASSCYFRFGAKDDLEVYSLVLESDPYKDKAIVLEELSNRGAMMDAMIENERVAGASAETIRDFKQMNVKRASMRWIKGEVSGISFITKKESERIFSKEDLSGWNKFYKIYPRSAGIVSLSNVGFNPDHTEALVYASRSCGNLCGSGEFYILTNKRGRWAIKKRIDLWVS
jgi:hypothetical protein